MTRSRRPDRRAAGRTDVFGGSSLQAYLALGHSSSTLESPYSTQPAAPQAHERKRAPSVVPFSACSPRMNHSLPSRRWRFPEAAIGNSTVYLWFIQFGSGVTLPEV